MRRAVVRAWAIALAGIGLFGAARLVAFAFYCPEASWPRRVVAAGEALPSDGFAVARADEVLAACTSEHCFGPEGVPMVCHEDRACYCVSRGDGDADALTRRFMAGHRGARECVVEAREPAREDEGGTCPRARCAEHVE